MAVPVPIRPRRLIEHARDLAGRTATAGRPRPIWLRRAISAAYYAAFHGLSLETVRRLAPAAAETDRYRLSRSIDHSRLADVCKWVTGPTAAGKQHVQPIVARLQQHPDIRNLAAVVHQLQEARYRADYDHLAAFDKATTLSYVAQAERALDILERLRGDPEFDLFLALIALHTQLR